MEIFVIPSKPKRQNIVIGSRLRQARERAGLTQREFAERIGHGEGEILRWEKGKTSPNSNVLILLARNLSVSIDWLAGLTDDPTGNFQSQPLTDLELRVLNALRKRDPRLIMYLVATDETIWPEPGDDKPPPSLPERPRPTDKPNR